MRGSASARWAAAFGAATLGLVLLAPRDGFAQYTFWTGTEFTRDTMPNPDNPNRPFVLRPGATQEQADAIAAAIVANMPNLNAFTNNPYKDKGTTLWNGRKTWDGYTLLTLLQGWKAEDGKTYGAVLIDMDGAVVNRWELMGLAKMLPNGSVLGGKGTSPELIGWSHLVQQDWCGNTEWEYEGVLADKWQATRDWGFPTANGRCEPGNDEGPYDPETNVFGCNPAVKAGDWLVSGWHHDYEREGNPVGYYFPGAQGHTRIHDGKTLVLAHHVPAKAETCPDETDPNTCISKYRLYDEAIYIVDWQNNVLFSWYPYQHFDEMGFLPKAREAIRETGGGSNNESAIDYQHFNNVAWVGQNRWWEHGDERFNPDYVIWDARQSNITAIIATSDHPRGKWKAGDIVWKIGPNYGFPYAESRLGQVIGQHMAHLIPKGLPGAGNMLIFDNGGGAGWGPVLDGANLTYDPADPLLVAGPFGALRPPPSRRGINNVQRNYSRVIEFNPQTLEVVWEYAQPETTADVDGDGKFLGNERLFFSFFISSAQRLPYGNTVITEGATGRVFEVTRDGEVVWEYIAAFVAGSSGIPESVGSVYRAYRVPYDWAPRHKDCAAGGGEGHHHEKHHDRD